MRTIAEHRLKERVRAALKGRVGRLLSALLLMAAWACQLQQDDKAEQKANFDKLYETLSQYDSVVIVFQDEKGRLLDTVLSGKVDSHSKVRNLEVDGWDGGKAIILIYGFNGGRLVYNVVKRFDGTTDQTDANVVLLTPDAELSSETRVLRMLEGDSQKYPAVTVNPPALTIKAINWVSSDSDVVEPGPDGIKAKKPGDAVLTVRLSASASVKLDINVTVYDSRLVPDGLAFEKDTLFLAVGESGKLGVRASPDGASAAATWSVENAGIAKVDSDGNVTASAEGITRLVAKSALKPGVSVTAVISVGARGTVKILSPAGDSYTNKPVIPVKWTVDGVLQDSLVKEELAAGPNTIIRTARDATGKTRSASIVVYLDTVKPFPPLVSGLSATNVAPVWRWATGGGNGSGDFRFKLGDGDLTSGATESRDTSFTLKDGLISGSTYTLFVSERDLAGNWSEPSRFPIKYDLSKPMLAVTSPAFSGTLYANSSPISISGTASGPNPVSTVAYAIGNAAPTPLALAGNAWTISAINLTEGAPINLTLTVTDAMGNTGSLVVPILMDNTPPGAPVFALSPPSPTKSAHGSWTWSAGSDGASGSGLNGHFRYKLNSGNWLDTTGSGVANLALPEGNNVLLLQEQDRAGLWSVSATSVVKVDVSPPAIGLQSHSNPAVIPSAQFTFSVTADDSGTGVQSVLVSGQSSGSGVLTQGAGVWTSANLTLKGGANTLIITATDGVGNSRQLNFIVNVDIPSASVIITDPADDNTVTNADSIDVGYTIDGAAGKKRFGLVEGANTLTVTSPPNASGAIGKDSVKVIRDATLPNAPNLSANAAITNGTATWTWTSNGDNTGGAGVKYPPAFRYSFDGGGTWTATSSTMVSRSTEGVYSLIVQEQDKAGNWSASSSARIISVDKTPPVVTITTPNNYITNKDSVTVSFTEQDSGKAPVSRTRSMPLPADDGANTVTISSAADAAGNVGTASITIYRRSKVVFVKTAASGAGDGSSWDNAAGGLQAGIARAKSGDQIWMAAGTYRSNSASGFVVRNKLSIYGGFSSTVLAYAVSQRDSSIPNATVLKAAGFSQDTVMNVFGEYENLLRGFVLNSVQVGGWGQVGISLSRVLGFEISNCSVQQFSQAVVLDLSSDGTFSNCTIQQNTGTSNIVSLAMKWDDPNGILFKDCTFQNNQVDAGARIVYAANFTKLTFDGCYFMDAFVSENDDTYHLSTNDPFPEVVVTIKNSTVLGGLSKIFHHGTLNYIGQGNTPPN